MNPYKSPEKKKPLKKKKQPTSTASSTTPTPSTSTNPVATASSTVRRPLHHIYLDEIAHRLAPTPAIPPKREKVLGNRSFPNLLETTSCTTTAPSPSVSLSDLSDALERLRAFDIARSHEQGESGLRSSNISSASGFSALYNTLSFSRSAELTEPEPVEERPYEVQAVLERPRETEAVEESPDETAAVGERPLETEAGGERSHKRRVKFADDLPSTSSQQVQPFISVYEYTSDESPELVDISEPLTTPSFDQDSNSALKLPLRHVGQSDYRDIPSTSTYTNIPKISSDEHKIPRECYRQRDPKNLRASSSQTSYRKKKSVQNVTKGELSLSKSQDESIADRLTKILASLSLIEVKASEKKPHSSKVKKEVKSSKPSGFSSTSLPRMIRDDTKSLKPSRFSKTPERREEDTKSLKPQVSKAPPEKREDTKSLKCRISTLLPLKRDDTKSMKPPCVPRKPLPASIGQGTEPLKPHFSRTLPVTNEQGNEPTKNFPRKLLSAIIGKDTKPIMPHYSKKPLSETISDDTEPLNPHSLAVSETSQKDTETCPGSSLSDANEEDSDSDSESGQAVTSLRVTIEQNIKPLKPSRFIWSPLVGLIEEKTKPMRFPRVIVTPTKPLSQILEEGTKEHLKSKLQPERSYIVKSPSNDGSPSTSNTVKQSGKATCPSEEISSQPLGVFSHRPELSDSVQQREEPSTSGYKPDTIKNLRSKLGTNVPNSSPTLSDLVDQCEEASTAENKSDLSKNITSILKRSVKKSSSTLGETVDQSGVANSSERNATALANLKANIKKAVATSSSIASGESTGANLGDFNHDLGEAILDNLFFGNDCDDDDIETVLYKDPPDKTKDNNTSKREGTSSKKNSRSFRHGSSSVFQSRSRRSRGQGGGTDSPDLEFIYDDTDTHGNEIAELYSYTEQPELQLNVRAFEDQMESYKLPPSWQRLPVEKRKSVIMKLLDQLEVSKKTLRMRSARCILYIAQGCWAEMQSDTEQQHWARVNCMLLYQLGVFSAFTDLLNIEIENSTAAHVAMRKIAVSLADSQDLRVILSVLYTITEVIRNEKATENTEFKNEVDAFCSEIGNAYGEDLLVIKLLGMVTRFCSGAAPHFPMKKVLLLLWKLILVSLGGMTALKDIKADKRQRTGLIPLDEDTMEITKTMRSSSPPASASDLLEAQNQKRNTRPFRRSLMKQSSLDDQESLGMEMETTMGGDNGDDLADMNEYDERRPSDNSDASQMYNTHNINMYNRQTPPPQHDIIPRGLPWTPKVRQKDLDFFLDTARQKFLGYSLPGDQETLFGLPEPIHEGVQILKNHIYTSLSELQIQKEEEIARNPLSTNEEEIDETPAEMLYQAMLPNLPQYMIALLKILLAAAPTSKAKTDSINIMADVLPEEMPMTVLQSMKLGIDVNRHKEIIVKAVSAILLLLLKHLKINHIYQFEFMSQHLVFANCIPLVLKFFNQNIMAYVGAKNVIPILDFPSCVIGDQPELTAESLEIGDAASFSWRNMFSCVNLLRILNKLTKWKHSRIMMLVVFKSAPILKRTLKVRHAMTQLYVLKLLKMQTKYLGRQWRKSNMKTISAIYSKVRHRLNDDWAYGNDLDARPWDFQAEECALRASVDRFNNRRYTQTNESEFEPVDNCMSSVLGAQHELSEGFKNHYDLWLEQEVFSTPIEWDKLLFTDTHETNDPYASHDPPGSNEPHCSHDDHGSNDPQCSNDPHCSQALDDSHDPDDAASQ